MSRQINGYWLLILFSAILLNLAAASAQITVTKTVPEKINFGDVLEANITVTNTGAPVNATVYETVVGAEAISPKITEYFASEDFDAVLPPQIIWGVILKSGDNQFYYKIKPLSVGFYKFSPTVVSADGKDYYSEPALTEVLSIPDGKCDLEIGEDYITSKDCRSGSYDNVCDGIADGKCDQDCTAEGDIDCAGNVSSKLNISGEAKGRGIINISSIILALAVLSLLFLIFRKRKKKKERVKSLESGAPSFKPSLSEPKIAAPKFTEYKVPEFKLKAAKIEAPKFQPSSKIQSVADYIKVARAHGFSDPQIREHLASKVPGEDINQAFESL